MIKDILDNFDIDFQKAIIDNYQLKDGLYVRIGQERVEYFIYKKPRDKESSKEIGLKDLEGNIRASEYEWFARRDYVSVYLNSNKAIDPPKKKIHNNNYLTLFVKAKEFNEANKEHFVTKLYDNLKTFASFTKKEEQEVLKSFHKYIFDATREKDIEQKKQRFLAIFDDIVQKKELIKEGEYIKIFFDEDLRKYEKEAQIYYALKIYNKIETVVNIDGQIYGLSDFNMGLNSKKPYLEHKTRGFNLPFMVKKDKIYTFKALFDFLKFQNNLLQKEASRHSSGVYITKHSSNDQAEIIDFDIVTNENLLPKPFILRDYLSESEDEEIKDFYTLFKVVDEVFYNGNLENNLYGDVYSKLPNTLQNLIYLTRDSMISLKRGEMKPLLAINRRYGDDFILYHLKQDRWHKAKDALNLKLSLAAYEGEKMDIKETLKNIEQKIESLDELESVEFFVLAGQIIKYLLDKSKKSDKRADMIEPFLRTGKAKKLKQEIETLFFAYKHEIPLNFKKFNSALALVEAYDKDERVRKDKLLIGILSENMFYKKDEK
ncbi:hypothetical protein [Nitrosophilus labii]|uniref:hypothetical protein n=1 Tax=Nitrosophilus labii TaxID=2706014 RepID=UPI001656DF77|nr:hypothetical protein [Nitrosophilus labii]